MKTQVADNLFLVHLYCFVSYNTKHNPHSIMRLISNSFPLIEIKSAYFVGTLNSVS